jgi:hypothetical protein
LLSPSKTSIDAEIRLVLVPVASLVFVRATVIV